MFLGEGGFGKIDNPLVCVICTCMPGAARWEPRCWVGIHHATGRCGGHGCGRNAGRGGSCGGSGRKTGWHIWLSTQSVGITVDVIAVVGMPAEIIMASMMFKI